MKNLDHLFKFPIIMVDGDNEEKKLENERKLALDNVQEVDIIYGEAEVPYYDFVSITDRWLPTEEGLEKALDGNFEACGVIFANSGTFIVPWKKDKFKKEWLKFAGKQKPIELTKEDLISIIRSEESDSITQGDK